MEILLLNDFIHLNREMLSVDEVQSVASKVSFWMTLFWSCINKKVFPKCQVCQKKYFPKIKISQKKSFPKKQDLSEQIFPKS